MGDKIAVKVISSLNKCFTDERIEEKEELGSLSLLANEVRSFQLACRMAAEHTGKLNFRIETEGMPADSIRIFRVIQMPCPTPVIEDEHDDMVLRQEAGLYPDMCLPFGEDEVYGLTNHSLVSFFFDINAEGVRPGEYSLSIRLISASGRADGSGDSGELLAQACIAVTVAEQALVKQQIIHTEWLYCDTLKVFYGVETFSKEHFSIIREYIRAAVQNGVNMLLTPVFTYALDTKVGGERPDTQLVGVRKSKEGYSFNYDPLDRFIEIALSEGIEYFEIGHLFSQWGAKAAPKVMAETETGYRKIFGWDTPGDDEGYKEFLRQFVPALINHLKTLGVEEKTFFHVSDEPGVECLERYKRCYELIASMVPSERIIDAMSNYSFYESGAIKMPVPATGALPKFLEAKVKPLWTYYCCDARIKLPNRYYAMPSTRNRILGILLYKYDIAGFLHWGFNFYFSQYSVRPINPFVQTDCDGFAESGDAYLVYPGADYEPIPSLRLKVLRDAFQDIRRLRTLEEKVGRDKVLKLIEDIMGNISFTEYPIEISYYERLDEKVVSMLRED